MNRTGVVCHPMARVIGEEHIQFDGPAMIDDFALVYAKAPLRVGRYVHIAAFSSVVAGDVIELGDFSGISHGARLFTTTEDFNGWGFGNPTVPFEYRNVKRGPIRIGRFCLVGANSVVLPGVTIGEGATLGACSLVTRDLDPWGVYMGNRRIGERDREGVLANYWRFLHKEES